MGIRITNLVFKCIKTTITMQYNASMSNNVSGEDDDGPNFWVCDIQGGFEFEGGLQLMVAKYG